LVENRRFEPTPPLFGAPFGVVPLEFRRDFWRRKTKVPGLSYDVVYVILGLVIFVDLRLVTDRQTGGRTYTRRQHIQRVRANITRSAVQLNTRVSAVLPIKP